MKLKPLGIASRAIVFLLVFCFLKLDFVKPIRGKS